MPDRDIAALRAAFDDMLCEFKQLRSREEYVAAVREKVRTLYQMEKLKGWVYEA